MEYFTYNIESFVPQLLMDGSNTYIYGPQGTALGTAPVEQISLSAPNSQSSVTYLLSDPQGVRLTFNSTGTITADASYDAYGNVTSGGLSNVTPFGYAGGYTDPTGLIYLINRYYDPSTGQFLSVDPLVGITDQPYQYAGGDPANAVDPLGLWGWNPISDISQAAHDVGHYVAKHKAAIAEIAVGVAVVAAVVVATVATGGIADAVLIGAASAGEELSAAVAGGAVVGMWGITFPLDVVMSLAPIYGLGLGGLGLTGYGIYQLFGGGSNSTKNKSACPS